MQAAAVVLIGGLLTSTLLTLVFVPAMFTIFDDMQRAVRRLFMRGQPSRSAPATAGAEPGRHPHPQVGPLPQAERQAA
ncbi:MAG: hypothetical protein IT305_15255 [Chloroflexi bacterium]|nr:hypothetical protein [Chloroflexota bacterium]